MPTFEAQFRACQDLWLKEEKEYRRRLDLKDKEIEFLRSQAAAFPALVEALENLVNAVAPDGMKKGLEPYFKKPISDARAALSQAKGGKS